jgi:hypothetical protein
MYNVIDEYQVLNVFLCKKKLMQDDLSMDDWKLVRKLKTILNIQ